MRAFSLLKHASPLKELPGEAVERVLLGGKGILVQWLMDNHAVNNRELVTSFEVSVSGVNLKVFVDRGYLMKKLTLERTLLYCGDDGQLTRYEIFKTDGDPANNIDSIHVYRERLVEGMRIWCRTDDEISLEHLGFPKDGGIQLAIQTHMRSSRDISAAVGECNKHWSKQYA